MKNCPKCGCDFTSTKEKEPKIDFEIESSDDSTEEEEGSEDEQSIKLQLLDELLAEIKGKVFKSKLDKFKE